MRLDPTIERLTGRVAARLAEIEGVVAVALGGSWARGEAGPDSDVDIGIYYRDDAQRPPFAAVRGAVEELDDRHAPEAVVHVGAWGPWMA